MAAAQPARDECVDRVFDGWQRALRNASKGDPHLTGTVTAL